MKKLLHGSLYTTIINLHIYLYIYNYIYIFLLLLLYYIIYIWVVITYYIILYYTLHVLHVIYIYIIQRYSIYLLCIFSYTANGAHRQLGEAWKWTDPQRPILGSVHRENNRKWRCQCSNMGSC